MAKTLTYPTEVDLRLQALAHSVNLASEQIPGTGEAEPAAQTVARAQVFLTFLLDRSTPSDAA